jgi:glycosyltransferase involved in cell wall biosynthesis
MAARIYPEERGYFDTVLAPLIEASHGLVRFVGEIGGADKAQLLVHARALLFPIEWAEPFGLVMIEALACGTPVIAWRRGSVPEIIDDGVNGLIVDNVDQAVAAIDRLSTVDRADCRRSFEARFDAQRMAGEYLAVYQRVIERTRRP